MFASLVENRSLVGSLIRRDVVGRYRGSLLGIVWSLLNPVMMLAVYTFVFSTVWPQRIAGGTGSKAEFALVLFAGLLVFNLFSECISRAPSVILGNVNYVKKVVFPLEVLPVVAIGSGLFHICTSLLVWLAFYVVAIGAPQPSALWLPIVLAPFVLMTMGLSWLLAALGVFLRDVAQVIAVVVMVLMFLSPVFYQIEAMPLQYRPFLYVSPVTVAIEQVRDVLMWGRMPDWTTWGIYSAASLLVAWLGYAFFQKTRSGFADVI